MSSPPRAPARRAQAGCRTWSRRSDLLAEILSAYARGETNTQHAVLEEVEPLLFGLARSLAPSGEDAHERAVAVTHALTLAFHLRAERGEIALKTANELRAYCHGAVARKLADTDPLLLPEDAGDNETASLVYKCLGLGLTIAAELDDTERTALVARLEGAPATEGPWRARLARLRVLRA